MFFNNFIEHLLTLTWSQGSSFFFSAQVFGSSKPMNKKSALLPHPCESLQGIIHLLMPFVSKSVHGQCESEPHGPLQAPCYGFILLSAVTSLHTQASTEQSGFLAELQPSPASTHFPLLAPTNFPPDLPFLIGSS